ncbi:hypothetical protein [Micromonospora inositola]|uniref:Uncharacterized protein n=1 Tax=Micromonospora inositola TaxID=47865 RepID=A0A1C5J420_9ACTN|nr:hypothetical protein [Micromonospora inositola]SCG65233.1 hypothetical protein GA0070613_3960 [Micromonospora inositola]
MSIVIYPASGGWRHSTLTKRGTQMCGRLSGIPADADPDTAKDAATGMVASLDACFFHLGLDVIWQPDEQPGWWTGSVYRINGEPI